MKTRRFSLFALLVVLVVNMLSSAEFALAGDGVVARVAAASTAFRAATELDDPEERATAFAHAAELHDAALDIGPPNGALEYNAANAWFLAGDEGRAILHYRRALLVRPGDPRVIANLDTARGRRRDVFEDSSADAITGTLLFWHSHLSLGAKVPLVVSGWAVGFVLLALAAWLPAGRAGRVGCRRGGALLIAAALALGSSVAVELSDRAARDAAVIVADEIALRTGDGASYPERYENPVHAGAEVRVVEERAGWVDIELPDGKRGWVPLGSVERI